MDPALARRIDPEDILSEAFLQARRKWSAFKRQRDVPSYAWLYRIVVDQLVEAWRRESRDKRDCRLDVAWPDHSSVLLTLHLVDQGSSPSEACRRQELADRVQKTLALLSDRDREILGMRHFDQLSFKDVASVLDITVTAATVRYTRALKRLAVGELGPDKKALFYENWKKLGEENAKLTKLPDPPKPRLAYDYSAYLALACGVDAGFPQAADALQTLLGLTGGFHELLADPAWRIAPRTALPNASWRPAGREPPPSRILVLPAPQPPAATSERPPRHRNCRAAPGALPTALAIRSCWKRNTLLQQVSNRLNPPAPSRRPARLRLPPANPASVSSFATDSMRTNVTAHVTHTGRRNECGVTTMASGWYCRGPSRQLLS